MAPLYSAAQHKQIVGQMAEKLVAQWLRQQGWAIVHERWHCRWGEIDLIAQLPTQAGSRMLVFVEVKARGDRNWDNGGLLAITPQKQAKLWRTAELFLAKHPTWSDWNCRFDVVLVKAMLAPARPTETNRSQLTVEEAIAQLPTITLGQPIKIQSYYLKIQQHLTDVFT